jgi:hypothetical protein
MTGTSSLREKALPRLRDLLAEGVDIAGKLRFKPNDQQHVFCLALLWSILEQAHGITVTLEVGNSTSSFILLRSALEAYIDLCNMANDVGYAELMHAAMWDQQRKMIDSANNRGASNPDLALLVGNQSVKQYLAWVKGELASLKTRGIKPLKFREKFDRCNKLDLYEGRYAMLCCQTHNNLNALADRHVEAGPAGIELHYLQAPDDSDSVLIIDTIAGIIANSVMTLKNAIEGGEKREFEGLSQKLANLRAIWGTGTAWGQNEVTS